ncbi:MAG: Imm12 family immunity protein [Porphyromonas sp.]|nr:Imm12 family immunity protein [Porphyromonas sp.]
MEIILSSAIGGDISPEIKAKNIHQLVIEVRKSLKTQFKDKFFYGVDKIKINLYVSGDISEYCTDSGVTKCRYFQKKQEIASEFCIDRSYWFSEPFLDYKRKFLLFMEASLSNLNAFMDKRLKSDGVKFDSTLFQETISESLISLTI